MKKGILAFAVLLLAGFWLALADRGSNESGQTVRSAAERIVLQGQNLPSSVILPAGDLPPAGTRSLFDHHIAQLGALPYPFERLLDTLTPLDRWGVGSVRLLIPDGRSLRKGEADFEQPRVLVAAQLDAPYSGFELAPVYSGRLFLGFVEAADEIEIISFNEAAGRFEYQLVQNYCEGCVPRIVYARRAICLACHQAGAPIFSVRPWAESNARADIAQRIAEARGVPWLEASSTSYHGAPVSTQLTMPETFDELAGLGSAIQFAQRYWLDACGMDGLSCRRSLLAQVLFLLMAPGDYNPASAASQRLHELQQKAWPESAIALPDDKLVDRDPLADSGFPDGMLRSLRQHAAEFLARFVDIDDEDSELSRKLAVFERMPRLAPELDPLSLRPPREVLAPDNAAGVQALAKLFTVNDRRRLLSWSDGQAGLVRSLILEGALDTMLESQPLNRVHVMQALARVLGKEPPDYCCLDTEDFSAPLTEDAPKLVISEGSVLEIFERYCFACHRGNPVQRLNFMGGRSEAEVFAMLRSRTEIRDVLDYERYEQTDKSAKLMPPPGSVQREMLEAARNAGADDLEKMRSEVPGLFDF